MNLTPEVRKAMQTKCLKKLIWEEENPSGCVSIWSTTLICRTIYNNIISLVWDGSIILMLNVHINNDNREETYMMMMMIDDHIACKW